MYWPNTPAQLEVYAERKSPGFTPMPHSIPAARRTGRNSIRFPGESFLRGLRFHTWDRQSHRRIDLDAALQSDALLHVIYSMRQELCELWRPSSASMDQLLTQLGDWRARADASGIVALQEFAASLPHLNCVRSASVEAAQRSAQSSQLVAGVRHL